VRALRRWLKSDEAVDVVAFFILREGTRGEDDPMADERELAHFAFRCRSGSAAATRYGA